MSDKAKASSGIVPMIMGLLPKLCWAFGLIALVVLLAGANGIGPTEMTMTMTESAPITLVVFVVMVSIAAAVQTLNSGDPSNLVEERCLALKAELEAQCAEVDKKVQTYLGAEYDKLKTENETLRSELDQIKVEENEKIRSEVEELRNRNQELKEELAKVEIALSEKLKAAEPNGDAQDTRMDLQEPEVVRASA